MSRRNASFVAVVVMCLLAGTGGGAHADIRSVVTQSPAVGSPDDPTGTSGPDTAAIAESRGISVQDTQAFMALQNSVTVIASELSRDPRVTGFWLDPASKPRLIIGVRSGVETAEISRSLPKDVATATVFVEQAYSEDELAESALLVGSAIRSAGIQASVNANVMGQRIEVVTARPTADVSATLESSDSSKLREGPPVVVIDDTGKIVAPAVNIYGGLTGTGCTLGFTVNSNTGLRGVTTAAHCGNTQSASGVSLPFKFEWYTGSSDVQ